MVSSKVITTGAVRFYYYMSDKEIRVPKEVREFVPDWAEETILGDPRGSRRQYRYGNLHIREYADEYTIHTDAVDPRKDKLGHLMYDAPEVLVGIGCGLAAGYVALRLSSKDHAKKSGSKNAAIPVALASGYAAYALAKKIRNRALARRRPASDDAVDNLKKRRTARR